MNELTPGDAISKISLRLLTFLLGAIVVLMMVLTTIDVVGRYVFNSPLPGTQEITQLLLALLVFAAAPLVTAERSHITTDLFDKVIKGRVRSVRNAIVFLLSALASAVLAWRFMEQASQMSSMSGATPVIRIPIGPFLYFCAVMAGVSALISCLQIVTFRENS